jgi:hypothetical protein
MSEPKYHHRIPRTYLRAWCYSNDSIYVMDKRTQKKDIKNINNNFGQTQFHSIIAGMPICEHKDLVRIFEALAGYEVFHDGKKLISLTEYNNHYYDFGNWVIKKDGKRISKKQKNIIFDKISKVKINEIETLWAKKYENRWPYMREIIEQQVIETNLNVLDEFYKGLIMKFVVAFNWRGFYGNDSFKSTYKWISDATGMDEIDIPLKERQKKYLKTVSEEFEHLLTLKKYREFLNDKGIIYDVAKNYIRLAGIKFYVAVGKEKFITTDNPSFIKKTPEGLYVHIMPVSPRVLISVGKNSGKDRTYIVQRISDKTVSMINKQIFDSSVGKIFTVN